MTVRSDARSRIAGSVENALSLGHGVLRTVYPREDVPEPQWAVETHSQHFVCDRCGRSFEPLSPHNFSFNSALGWCPACEGLGTQIGTNPAALLRGPKLTLAQGAVALWPLAENRLFAAMLEAFSRGTGIPIDVPFDQLGGRHRRLIFHGAGEQWFECNPPTAAGGASGGGSSTATPTAACGFAFQYKGLYPALEEASRVSPTLRAKLEHLVDEVECSVCGGSRLRDDAAAVRLHTEKRDRFAFAESEPVPLSRGRTIDELCRLPLGRLLEEFQELGVHKRTTKSGRRSGA